MGTPSLLKKSESGLLNIESNKMGISIQAFEEGFKCHFNALHTYAFSILNEVDEAEEIVQQVFLKVWEKREQLSINQSFRAYLYQSVYHESLNYLKHQKVKKAHQTFVQYQQKEGHESMGNTIGAKELQEKILEGLSLLPEQCRTIFQLSRFEDLKYREIADKLGLSIKTIENQMGKALKIMRTHLAAYLSWAAIAFLAILLTLIFR